MKFIEYKGSNLYQLKGMPFSKGQLVELASTLANGLDVVIPFLGEPDSTSSYSIKKRGDIYAIKEYRTSIAGYNSTPVPYNFTNEELYDLLDELLSLLK